MSTRTQEVATISIGQVPPSLNALAHRHWRVYHGHKQRWQRDLGLLLMAQALPRGLERVEASATLCFPTRRRRDTGNFRALLEKSLGDALVEGRCLADDTPDRYEFGAVTFAEDQPRTAIELRWTR